MFCCMNKEEQEQQTKQWAAQTYGIKPEDVDWYNSGICYDRICVNSKDAADKVTAKVQAENRTANGGMFHGMPLGSQSKHTRKDGSIYYDITC